MINETDSPTTSSERLNCPHGDACGACGLLGTAYDHQLGRKRDLLGAALRRHEPLRDVELLETIPSPRIEGYRNRVRMAVGPSKHHSPSLGSFRQGTREIVDAPDCRILLPELLETTRRIRRFLATSEGIPRELRHIDVRCGSHPRRQHLILVFRAATPPRFPLDRLRRACPYVDGISFNFNPSAGPQVLRGRIEPLWGEREIWVEYAGMRLRVSPGSFFQVNSVMLAPIHEQLQQFFERGTLLADLYAGVGTHGLALHRSFRRVLFVEGMRSAVADLKSTLRAHGIGGAEVVSQSAERSVALLRERNPDAIVLNPSRAGAREFVLDAIADTSATRVAYLSCEPETLTRDLELLAGRGFSVRSIQPIDMMPQTRQVEALALLVRSGKPVAKPNSTAKTKAKGRERARKRKRKR